MLRRVVLGAILAVSFSYAHAADNARIKGTVTDPTGAVVPKAQVTATNEATGVAFQITSQPDGAYEFLQLPVGTYTITVAAPGFKEFSARGITITIDQQYVEQVKLSLGSSADKVLVEADAVQVNTTDMQLSNVVDAAQIVEYPLIGRAFTQLELILPGVQASSDRFSNNYSVNGSQTQQSSYLINGADTNDFALNTIGIQPNVDALDQFNLITGPLNAEYSRNSGAIVSAVVKSGTNRFHGDGFWFYRDTFMNNSNFFQYNATTNTKVAQVFHQNLFGGTIGGPILKDKLFFFAAYQGNRAREPGVNGGGSTPVPSALQRSGNFTGTTFSKNFIPGTLSIPGCVSAVGGVTTGADTFATCAAKNGGVFPSAAFNPIAASLLSTYVPLPNSGTRYIFNSISNLIQDQAIGHLDFNPTVKDQISFILLFQHQPTVSAIPFTGASLPGFGEVDSSQIWQYSASYSRQLNSTTLNQLALHYTRFNLGSVNPAKVVLPSSLGFAINPQNAAGASVPLITLTGGFTLGFSTNGPQPRIDQTYQIDENFSKVIGHHSLKFGFDGRQFSVDNEFSARNNGSFGFSQTQSTNPNTSGNVYLDFLLGNPSSYSQGAGGRISAKSWETYLYAQDSWKTTANLTLNFGLGYQIDTGIDNNQYQGKGVNCFVPGQQSKVFPTAPLSLAFPGDPGCTTAQGAITPWKDFGPRIGFSWAPDLGLLSDGATHKLSISGGYGIYYNRTEEEGSLQNLSQVPYGINSSGTRDTNTASVNNRPTFANPYENISTGSTLTNPFPASFPQPGATNVTFPVTPLELSGYGPGYRAPYAQNYQITVQREFPGQFVATASYVGSVARHNQVTVEGNPITQAGHDACLNDPTGNCQNNLNDQEVLYPSHTLYPQKINAITGATQFGSASQIITEGSSNFNALELSLKKGQTHGLAMQVSYTYGHAMDDGSSFEGAGFGGERGYNQYQKGLNYGNSDYDARNRFVFAPIYTVPYRASGGIFSLSNLALAGWQIAVISTFAQGHPFDISYQGGESYALYCSADYFYYTCPDIPNQVAPLQHKNPRSLTTATKGQFFDGNINTPGASFTDETLGFFGNISRNKYYGPGIDNTNAQISKNFRYSTDDTAKYIELRVESYNVFNHTNFNNPNGNPDNGPAIMGVITTAAAGRQFQLSGKVYF